MNKANGAADNIKERFENNNNAGNAEEETFDREHE